ncbi:hypothetical protein AAFC00_003238 [Neodothiora populina]
MSFRNQFMRESPLEVLAEHDDDLMQVRSEDIGPMDARSSVSTDVSTTSKSHNRSNSISTRNFSAPSWSDRYHRKSTSMEAPRRLIGGTTAAIDFARRSSTSSDEIDSLAPEDSHRHSSSTRRASTASVLFCTGRTGQHKNQRSRGDSVASMASIPEVEKTQPRQSISVQNVVIPASLIRHMETSWAQEKPTKRKDSSAPRNDSEGNFDVAAIAREQQREVESAVAGAVIASDKDLEASELERYDTNDSSIDPAMVSQKSSFEKEPRRPEPVYNKRNGGLFGDFSFTPGQKQQEEDEKSTIGSIPEAHTRKASRLPSLWRAPTAGTMNSSRRGTIFERTVSALEDVAETVRRSTMWDIYENAKVRQVKLQRKRWVQLLFQYSVYTFIVAFIYLVLVGLPLWKGAVYWFWYAFSHKFAVPGSWAVVIGVAFVYAYTPLLILFEKDPPMPEDLDKIDATKTPGVQDCALMIPCYKAATLIGPTLEAATKIFPPSHIFVIANGNSPTPLDNTEEICDKYGVNHIWSPVGSKIVAQFVGCHAMKGFKNVLLIDDDCALPPNFPIVTDRMTDRIKCIGYTIKSVGPNSTPGTLCQQSQDLEYKLAGLQRALAGKIGSATFPHGAISLWDRDFLVRTFNEHPGFSVSEDWFFGHVAREQGSRITMCTSVFIETETPDAVFFSSGGERGGFGEMTVFKQRFLRWNFFFVNGMYYNLMYILTSWKLGWWELGAKLFVFQETYESLLYIFTPFVLPISLVVRYQFTLELLAGTFGLYFINIVIFNEIHLRLKGERVGWKCVYLYYMPYKFIMSLVNVASCYWAIYKYATYFAKRHAKIIEDDKAVNVVLQLEENGTDKQRLGRRMTVTAIGTQTELATSSEPGARRVTVTTLGSRLAEAEPLKEDTFVLEREMSMSRMPTLTLVTSRMSDQRKMSVTYGGRKASAIALNTALASREIEVVDFAMQGAADDSASIIKKGVEEVEELSEDEDSSDDDENEHEDDDAPVVEDPRKTDDSRSIV